MVLKFLHLQSHFIHLYFFTVFEVLFYIYYILPYEKSIFKHIFDDDISSISKINITTLTEISNPYISINKCSIYQNNLDNDNKYIYDYCFIYIYMISSIFIIMFFRDIWKNYSNYNTIYNTTYNSISTTKTQTQTPTPHNISTLPLPSPKYDSKSSIISFGSFQNLKDYKKNDDKESSISMIEIPKNNNENKNTNNNSIIENQTFRIYYWNNSGFISELIKTIEFIIFVGIFEYIFFVYIVNKFKIANSKTIFCNIYKKIIE
jgi:hypothetical protein